MALIGKKTWMRGAVDLLSVCLTFLFVAGVSPVLAQTGGATATIVSARESYQDRPSVLSLKAESSNLGPAWQSLKAAHFSFIATLLELYPRQDIYFLARDSEHLYDVAQLVTEGSKESSRLHLLNVSRANMRDPKLRAYLAENGISEASLRAGKEVLFVDTGFAGTIPKVVGELFSDEARSNLKTQLLVSSNPAHPSSRVFLRHLNPEINGLPPASMHGTIVSYEHLPRYTDRSDRYESVGGRLHPTSPVVTKSDDGEISKEGALRQMKDLKAEWEKPAVRKRFAAERLLARDLIARIGAASAAEAVASTKALLESRVGSDKAVAEAVVRDVVEASWNARLKSSVSLMDLGLSQESGTGKASKIEIMQKYPKWAKYLENPVPGIESLVQEKNWQLLGTFIDLDIDREINQILAKNLFREVGEPIRGELRMAFLKRAGNSFEHEDVLRHDVVPRVFGERNLLGMKEEAAWIVQRLSAHSLVSDLAPRLLTLKPGVETHLLLGKVIEKALEDNMALRKLATDFFSKPEALPYRAELMMLIQTPQKNRSRQDRDHRAYIAEFVFGSSVGPQLREELRTLLRVFPDSATYLMEGLFTQPEAAGFHEEFREAWKLPFSLERSLSTVFAKPHSSVWSAELRDYVGMKSGAANMYVVASFFQHAEAAKDIGLLKAILGAKEQIPDYDRKYLEDMVFSKDFARTPEHRILLSALQVQGASARTAWMDGQFRKIKSPLASVGLCERVLVGP